MAMSDEEWRVSERARRVRKEGFQKLARNPTDATTVYRMQSGDPNSSLGIHWTTDPEVAHFSGLGGQGDDRTVHRATVSRESIISEAEWKGKNIQGYNPREDPRAEKGYPSQWGLPGEAEVRLRPGTTLQDHATAPGGTKQDYTSSGREPTIEDRGRGAHKNLAYSSVPGTPEAERLHRMNQALPHVQKAMLDPVHERGSGRLLGHVPSFDVVDRADVDFGDAIDAHIEGAAKVASAAGVGEWDFQVERPHEPMLAELRAQPTAATPTKRRLPTNMTQFPGLEDY